MRERILISWRLVRASAGLLRRHGDLMIFPIVAAFGMLIVISTFLASGLALNGFDAGALLDMSWRVRTLVTFLFYVVVYAVIFYANTALVGATLIALDGGEPTIRDGLHIARQHASAVLGYAIIMATVGMILRMAYRLGGPPGRFLGPLIQRYLIFSLVGLAWHLVTFLVVPVLVVEDLGPVEAVKRSARLIRDTWGEQIVGNTSIWLIFTIPVVLLGAAGFPLIRMAVLNTSDWTITLALYLYVLLFVTLMLVEMALHGIFSAVVYRYAVAGEVAGAFDERVLRRAFRPQPTRAATRLRRLLRLEQTGSRRPPGSQT